MISPRIMLRIDIGSPKRTMKRKEGGYENPKRRANARRVTPIVRMFFLISDH